ncbi:MAG TPA: hypothetical protein VIQ03_10500 [Gammaproteobacteria bacterium]
MYFIDEWGRTMNTRIIINGKEVTSPLLKTLLVLGAIIVSATVIAIVVFVLLPLIGVAVTLSAGFIIVFVIAAIVGVAILVLVAFLSAWLFGAAELRIERIHKRK